MCFALHEVCHVQTWHLDFITSIKLLYFQGDSEIVFKAVSLATPHPSFQDHFVKDIQSISNSFRAHSFSHVRRHGNSVAHTSARRARFSFPLIVWMEAAPPEFSSFVIAY